jgi:hypothetical protein
MMVEARPLDIHLADSRRAHITELGELAPTILFKPGPWALDTNAEDLGAVCFIDQLFDLNDLEHQIRRCIQLGANLSTVLLRQETPDELGPACKI